MFKEENPFDKYLKLEISVTYEGQINFANCYISPEMLKDQGINESLQHWFNNVRPKISDKIREIL